jgi:hypothetical protein
MNWETKFSIQLILLGVGLILALPFCASLAGRSLTGQLSIARFWMDNHLFREITGYMGLTLALLQIALSFRKRIEWNFPGPSFPTWRGFHILAGVAFLLVVVIHTGGQWGWNLNGWLQSVFVLTVFAGLIGKVWESQLLQHALPVTQPRPAATLRAAAGQATPPPPLLPPSDKPGTHARQIRSQINRARNMWLGVHIVLTSAFVTLLGFHVFSVYYF